MIVEINRTLDENPNWLTITLKQITWTRCTAAPIVRRPLA